MPQALLSREDLLDRLLGVFRDRGFDGATIAEIARATGLGKASLY
ncbi:MAG: TetR family transcriptional regulator, partial [Gammaproteobacteria bacterium]|nr:TetR family transcriptional regulator [Gammaproteobacteria bacterium]